MIARYRNGEATEAEQRFLEQYDGWFDGQQKLSETMTETEKQEWYAQLDADLEQRIGDVAPVEKARVVPMYKKLSWAAAIVILLAGGWWLMQTTEKQVSPPTAVVNDILPGKQRATLTLADGSKVVIEKDKNGLLTTQGATSIENNNGSLAYNGKTDNGPLQYNILTTQKGEQSGVRLSDGTVVYVDAATQLRYPVTFAKNERVIDINEGQAFFEVAHDGRPFFVKKGNKTVEVLGTHFNVMAYGNEPDLRVTLVQGSVKVKNGSQSAVIKPGSQAILSNASEGLSVDQHADTLQAIAWRRGRFVFNEVPLRVILKQVERWYDVDVEIKGALPKEAFLYKGRRSDNLSELLRAFEVNQIPYKVDAANKKLIVNP